MNIIKLTNYYSKAVLAIVYCWSLQTSASPIESLFYSISWPSSNITSWTYTIKKGQAMEIQLPSFEWNGRQTPVILKDLHASGAPVLKKNNISEYHYEGTLTSWPSVRMEIIFRVAPDNPVVRFRYRFKSAPGVSFSKKAGADRLSYLSASLKDFPEASEVRLTVFNEMFHSCLLHEVPLEEADFRLGARIVGPLLVASGQGNSFLMAYEHDSMYPNPFIGFRLSSERRVEMEALKGNYYAGQQVDGYTSVWMEVAGVNGNDDLLARQFRDFMLRYQSDYPESRKPYIFYNTWGRQERDKWSGGQYLTNMNLAYTLKEIDRAHEMGLEYYVLDAGWFDRTGDWGVHPVNFPDGFGEVKKRIEKYGMKLGVWLDPSKAAVKSAAYKQNPGSVKTRGGKAGAPSEVWETEPSVDMCLVSSYWEYHAKRLIELYNQLGISYFYIDGIGQSGCDDPGHHHGTAKNSTAEREENYGFLMPVYLQMLREKVLEACPDVIFDYDVTESRRIGAGLQFLSSGRYFILNNGPYFHNFDLSKRGESPLPNGNRNIFVNPGPARGWFMRSVLSYDKWIPSQLFMVNYQSDDPRESQLINMGSLVLGANSIWGHIQNTSPEGVRLVRGILDDYRTVREACTKAPLVLTGQPGDSPEIYERIDPGSGKGVVVIFSNQTGRFSYITRSKVSPGFRATEGSRVEINEGTARITAEFKGPSAAIVFFGIGTSR